MTSYVLRESTSRLIKISPFNSTNLRASSISKCLLRIQPSSAAPSLRSKTLHHLPRNNLRRQPLRPMATSPSSPQPFPAIVSPQWLKDNFSKVKILDATWYMPNSGKDAIEEFKTSRIPGAQYFDLDLIADTTSTTLPHMLPREYEFSAAADALSISNTDSILIYDRTGMFSSPRAWWTWKVMGHGSVCVLSGGLPAWEAAVGATIDTTPLSDEEAHKAGRAASLSSNNDIHKYKAVLDKGSVRDASQMVANITSQEDRVIDARPAARWQGAAPEPRAGLKMGHIPGSINIPWSDVQKAGEGVLVSDDELLKKFEQVGVDVMNEGGGVVMTCGSGTTACIMALAVYHLNPKKKVAVYDGSWSEYGGLEGVPVTTTA